MMKAKVKIFLMNLVLPCLRVYNHINYVRVCGVCRYIRRG